MLSGKKGLIMGVANERSIAWGIAKACHKYGANLAFSYQGEVLEKRVRPLAAELGSNCVIECDVTNEQSIDKTFEYIEKEFGELDFLVHAIAFSDKNELRGRYVDTTRDNFLKTMDISCYSFTSVARRAEKLMKNGGSMVTLSYYGAEKYVPHYNVMGVAKAALEASIRYMACDLGPKNIRVNAISAGPVKTLAASGIGDFKLIFKWNEENTPLKRNITIEDVGGAGVYLLSELGSGVTGEVLHVDSGYHTIGMKMLNENDLKGEW
jgi:enoyl-[acyl-carrier protein] reductase I